MNIGILGANSHVARNLISCFLVEDYTSLCLYSRSAEATAAFVSSREGQKKHCKSYTYQDFGQQPLDAIINCVGIADPNKQKTAGLDIFTVTETYDNLALDYITRQPQARYINFSSGAVYGTAFSEAVDTAATTEIAVNAITPADYYRIAKINAEAKHRSLTNHHIIDLRLFSFFSRYIDLNAGFLLCELIRCAQNKSEFITNEVNIIRDYIHPKDLFTLISILLTESKLRNGAIDLKSKGPINKFELLSIFEQQFGLQTVLQNTSFNAVTGQKTHYYAKTEYPIQGFTPFYTSKETIIDQLRYFNL